MSKPRVTASHTREPVTAEVFAGQERTTPGVEIRVDFDLHDHERALAVLDRAVADVIAQIKETA